MAQQGLYLSQKQVQTMVLAPQLQQSLAMLQAPNLELKALVEQELEQNPVLEELSIEETRQEDKDTGADRDALDALDPTEPPADLTFDPATEKESSEPVDDFQAEFEKLVQLDQEWRDHFSQQNVPSRSSAEDEEKRQFMFDSLVAETSLQEFLLEQVREADLPDQERSIADMIVGNIDERGYLATTVKDLSYSTAVPTERIQTVVDLIQSFQPPGVACADLQECLRLQLERAERTDELEYAIVCNHFDSLARRKFPEIVSGLGRDDVDVIDVQKAAERISHLEPHPGRAFLSENQQYIVPEVFVQKMDGEWLITMNNDQIPHLRISNTYKDIMSSGDSTSDDREYIREKIRAGKFLIKSLHQRQSTIANIATEILKRQNEFFEHGTSKLKPLTMVQVAEVVGVHETTVSRAVSGKYMETPHGVFEMKYFFTSGFKNAEGTDVANTSIKDMIADLIKEEDAHSPLSDDAIVKLLVVRGLKIARRTVAKYRGELNILPSNLRRVY
jgi:RNA polymerase sigma-54 factor